MVLGEGNLAKRLSEGFLFILLGPTSKGIGQTSTNQIDQTQSYSRTSNDASRTELIHDADSSPPGEDQIGAAQGGSGASAVNLVALEIEIGGEHEKRGKDHGHRLKRTGMLGKDEGGEQGRRDGVLCQKCK